MNEQTQSPSAAQSDEKMVPVGEAIRYRKRAQAAEEQAADFSERIKQLGEENSQLTQKLAVLKLERKLQQALLAEGVLDVEAAMLIAKSRASEQEKEVDIPSVVEQLKEEKGYLFAQPAPRHIAPRTSGVKDRPGTGPRILEAAADKAARSGRAGDMQHYLRLRRQFT